MKRWKIGVLACACVLCLSVVLTGCNSSTYEPQLKDQTVSSSALGKSGTLRVGVNASSAPLAGQTSSSSRIVGIDVDVAAYLADQLGAKLEIVDVGNDPVSALSGGNVDVVLGVDSSENEADYWRSNVYLSTGVALFAKNANAEVPAVDSKPKIAAQASSRSSWRVTNLFGDGSLVTQSDLKSAFAAMDSNSAQYVAADAVIGTYVAHSNGYQASILALLQTPSGYCAAVPKSNTELQSAISSAMATLVDGGVMDIIEEKWLGSIIDLDDMPVVKAPTSRNTEGEDGEQAEGESGSEGADASQGADGASADGTGAPATGASATEAAGNSATDAPTAPVGGVIS